jgi:acyl-[acyl-carrier-protein] desaturase
MNTVQPSAESSPDALPATIWSPHYVREAGIAAVRVSGLIHTGGEPDQLQLLTELEPVVASNLERHDSTRKFWTPRDFFPIDQEGRIINRARDLPGDTPSLTPAAQAAMVLNLLTEDNLPAYHRVIAANYGLDSAWGTWVNKWTAEEARHGYVMRAFLDLTGYVDAHELEIERIQQMERGYDDGNKDPLHGLAYVAFQELATRVSHRNTGTACNDTLAHTMLQRVAADENLHMVFYRNLVAEAFELAPNQTMRAVADEVIGFAMPGSNMQGYQSKALLIAQAGIYDLRLHKDQVVEPILRKWNVFGREDLSGDGERARDELAAFMAKLEKQASRFEAMRSNGTLEKIIQRALESETTAAHG